MTVQGHLGPDGLPTSLRRLTDRERTRGPERLQGAACHSVVACNRFQDQTFAGVVLVPAAALEDGFRW